MSLGAWDLTGSNQDALNTKLTKAKRGQDQAAKDANAYATRAATGSPDVFYQENINPTNLQAATNAKLGAISQATTAQNAAFGAGIGQLNLGINDLQTNANTALGYLSTLRDTGSAALAKFKELAGIGTTDNSGVLKALENTPGYQFALKQGLDATKGTLAARGMTDSGAAAVALNNYAQGAAQSIYFNTQDRLLSLINATTPGFTQSAQIQSDLGNNLANQRNNMASLLAEQGMAQGQAEIAKGTALADQQTQLGKTYSAVKVQPTNLKQGITTISNNGSTLNGKNGKKK